MSQKISKHHEWKVDHPLFKTGGFPLISDDRSGKPLACGVYNSAISSIYIRRLFEKSDGEVFLHEVTHHTSRFFLAGVDILNTAASWSHVLILHLLEAARQQKIRLIGTNLNTLRLLHPHPDVDFGLSLVENIKTVESLYEHCELSLLPVLELFPIDFETNVKSKSVVIPVGIPKHARFEKVLRLAEFLSPKYDQYYGIYQGVKTPLLAAWFALDELEPVDRIKLMSYTTTTLLAIENDVLCIKDILLSIPQLVLHFQRNKTSFDLFEETGKLSKQSSNIFETLSETLLKGTPKEYLKPIVYRNVLSILEILNYQHDYKDDESIFTWANTRFPLLTFMVSDYGKLVLINKNYTTNESILDNLYEWLNPSYESLQPWNEKIAYMLDNKPLHRDWWQHYLLLETIRQTIKKGNGGLVCPFKGYIGADCDANCFFRNEIEWLQQNSQLCSKNPFCILEQ